MLVPQGTKHHAMPPLPNPKWEQICQERAKGETMADSYTSVGLKRVAQTIHLFFKKPEIIARIREIQNARIKREFDASENAARSLSIDKRWVLERLKYNAERCLRGQPVLDTNGVQIPGKFTGKPDAMGANRALHLIGLELGMFIERHEIGGPGDFARLSDDELAARVEADAAALGLPQEATEALLLTFQPTEPIDPEEDGT